jgi:hypothetical protein
LGAKEGELTLPNVEPTHVFPFFPQAPSVEILFVVEHVPDEALQPEPQKASVLPQKPALLQQSPNEDPLHVFPFFPQAPSVEILFVAEHVPDEALQPEPQKASVLPQKPALLQQSPNEDPLHVFPFFPQAPSIDTLSAVVQFPKPDLMIRLASHLVTNWACDKVEANPQLHNYTYWHPGPQNAESAPQ